MFALEIDFKDGISPPETILVRRPHAIIGNGEYAHVVVEGAASGLSEFRVTRGIGREFRCHAVRRSSADNRQPGFLEGAYKGNAELNLGEVTAHLTPLDVDLQIQSSESPDRAGLRILRSSLNHSSPMFPAVVVLGPVPLFLSFRENTAVFVGRSRKCILRLDASDVSRE
ncbi:hypothetical protein BVY02_02530, partial [bacterium J17]